MPKPQVWAEKANLSTQGQPHLLVGSILDLREEIKCYISLPDETIFSGMALPEGPLTTQLEETAPKNAQPAYADSPAEEAAVKVTEEEPTRKEQPPN